MPTASMAKPIRLVRLQERPKHAQNKKKRPQVDWMDVSDNEEKRRAKLRKRVGSSSVTANNTFAAIQEQRKRLPIAKGKDALVEVIGANDVTVLLGETGSGKTTRELYDHITRPSSFDAEVPQYLLEAGLAGSGMIAVTQPRRVAATSLAARVAAEQGTTLGSQVGYAVRFDERAGPMTRIKYVTDGMLLRELLSDPLLERYGVVVIDEAHERTLRTDLLLASLKTIQAARRAGAETNSKGKARSVPPLRIVVMSATIDAEKFSRFFHNARIIYVQGRQHPVTILHTAIGQIDYLDAALRTFFQIHTDQPPGDVLIFLPGQEDIESLEKSIQLYAQRLPQEGMGVLTCAMYAAQASGQTSKAFAPAPLNTRKCVLATNIAETSITIPGIRYVIDTGKHKEKRYLARNTGGGFDTLLTRDITQSSAMQRAGRAGREGKGFCYRLYTEDAFRSMEVSAEPEILRVSLTAPLLQIMCLGQDIEELELMDRPDQESIVSALKTLYLLGALNQKKQLTSLGRQMAALPIEPSYARAVLASKEHSCTAEVLDIVSVLSASSKLFHDVTEQRDAALAARSAFRHPSGDHLTVLAAVRAYAAAAEGTTKGARREWCRARFLNERALAEARDIRIQLAQACTRLHIDPTKSCGDDAAAVLRCLAHGLVQNAALVQPDGTYRQVMGQAIVKIHPGSVLADKKVPAIVYDELVYTSQIYARGVSSIPKSFFGEVATLSLRET